MTSLIIELLIRFLLNHVEDLSETAAIESDMAVILEESQNFAPYEQVSNQFAAKLRSFEARWQIETFELERVRELVYGLDPHERAILMAKLRRGQLAANTIDLTEPSTRQQQLA